MYDHLLLKIVKISFEPIRPDSRARVEQLHNSFYNKKLSLFLYTEQGTYNSSKNMTHFLICVFQLQFMLKSQQKVLIKLSKICQSHQKLSKGQKVASHFTEIVYKSSSEDSQKCRSRFKLFVDLLDSLKQGTTGQLSIYDSCWLLQTVPGFADFAGVAEITRLNTSEFLYLSGWKVQQWTCIRIQFCLFKQHWRRNYRAVYPTAHKVCLWFFWFNQLLPQTLKLEENIYIVLCLLLRFSCFWPTMNSLMLLKERSFANSLLIWKVSYWTVYPEKLFPWPPVCLLVSEKWLGGSG